MQGHHCKNYDHINRLLFRIISQRVFFIIIFFFFNYYLLSFCSRSQITWRDFFPFSIILIEQFCSCYTEPHISFTCSPWWTTSRAKFLTYLRPIGLEFPHISQKTLSFLHSKEIRQITKTTVIFKTRAIFVCCMRYDPIPPKNYVQRLAYSQHYHLSSAPEKMDQI